MAKKVTPAEFYEVAAKKGRRPVVLAHQPTSFRILQDPEELRAWEKRAFELVGFSRIEGMADVDLEPNTGTSTDSECPDADDCDWD